MKRFPVHQTWRIFISLSIALSIVVWTTTSAQPPIERETAAAILDKKLVGDAKNGSEIMANLTYLSDVIGPRLTGSANLKRANEWTAEKMKSYGLTDVHLEPWELPMAWERGTAIARIIE